jgi:four helix bundle protein
MLLDLGQSGGGIRTERGCRLARFCSIALGSASELDYRLLLARDLKLINPKDYGELASEPRK